MNRIGHWLNVLRLGAPVFPGDEARTRRAAFLYPTLLLVLALAGLYVIIGLVSPPRPPDLLIVASFILPVLAALGLMRAGHVSAGAILFLLMLLGMIFVSDWTARYSGGSVAFYIGLVVAANYLLGWRWTLAFTGVSLIALAATFYANAAGRLPVSDVPPLLDSVTYGGLLLIVVFIINLSNRIVDRALSEARGRSAELDQSRQLLEQRIAERTAQLEASAKVGRAISSVLNTDELIDQVVNLISDSFDYYYAAVFLVDEKKEWAVLKAATGEAGRALLDQAHKLEVGGQSMVGTVTATRKPRIALDVGAEPVRFDNPYLPETRSEIALPLAVGDQIIGALDVQSKEGEAFDEATAAALQGMADQIAIAINNARSFERQLTLTEDNLRLLEQAEATVADLNALTARLTREGWDQFLMRQEKEIRVFAGEPPSAGRQSLIPTELEKAMRKRTLVTSDADGDSTHSKKLAAPIKLRGEVIGGLSLEAPGDEHTWSADDITVLTEVAEHIALAVDNARLFEETHQRLTEQNWLYRVTTAVASAPLEQALQNATEALQTALRGAHVTFLLLSENRRTLHVIASAGYPTDLSDLEIDVGQGVTGWVALTGQPARIADVRQEPRYIEAVPGVLSELALPLTVGNEVIGVINLESEKIDEFSEHDEQLVSTLSSTIAAIIGNARLLDSEQRQRRAITVLAQTAGRMSETLSEAELRQLALDELYRSLEPDQISLYEWDAAQDHFVLNRRRVSQATLADKYVPGDTITPADRPDLWTPFETQHPDLAIRQTPDGQPRTYYILPWAIGNTPAGVLEIIRDPGQPIRAEDQLLCEGILDQAANALRLARLYTKQRETAERLAEIDMLKSQFLANMSHELRTPLNSIIGFSRVILKGIDGPITELQEQDLTAIYSSGQHLLGLINDVLDVSKIEAGKMELAFSEVDLHEIINSVMSTATGLVKDKPVQLHQYLAPDVPTVRADSIRVRQVLLNLISNAAKFTDDGDITVRTRLVQENGRPFVQVSVIDSGPGIAEVDQDKLFKAFSQVDPSPTRKVGGSGLGLAITKYLVDMHGGRIWVESEIGVGSTFYFTMPTFHAETHSPDGAGEPIIFAIDDDERVHNLYQRYVEAEGYHLEATTEGTTAVARAAELQPAVILLDIRLPDKDGWELLRQLKTTQETRAIPVIVCSIDDDTARAAELGAAAHLVKPILQPDLLAAIERRLAK